MIFFISFLSFQLTLIIYLRTIAPEFTITVVMQQASLDHTKCAHLCNWSPRIKFTAEEAKE